MAILIVGTTGMVGSEATKVALRDSSIQSITALSRRTLEIAHSKLTSVVI